MNAKSPNQTKPLKKLLLISLIALIVGNTLMYVNQRNEWLYDGQPYPKAKEWLIGANFMMVYGNFLTKLPFVDEKSLIVQPVLALQDYFIKRWKENLPDDDAEKYADWYVFRLMMYIMNTSGSTVLYGNNKYSFEETIEFNEKAWETIENMVKFEAKDKMFQKIRLAAFNNLSIIFTNNFTAYWIKNPLYSKPKSKNYRSDESQVNIPKMLKDVKQHERLIKLREYIKYMNALYSSKYPEIYDKARKADTAEYLENKRIHVIASQILYWQIRTNRHANIDGFCQTDKNEYLKDYIETRKWFLANEDDLKAKGVSIKSTVIKSVDDKIKEVCEGVKF